jgi:hypothetical protein
MKARKGPPPVQRFLRSDADVKVADKGTDFFVTSAVNNSPAALSALKALEHAATECKGQLHILPVRYKNPTQRHETREEEWWAPELVPYLIENEVRPHPLLSLMATRIQATADNPLPARLDGRTKARSAVFGHPQLAMRTVATPQQRLAKILYSSGAITEKSYSDTLAGDVARFHHSIAAVKVEVRGDRFHLREITWDGEKFIDLDRMYTPAGVVDAPRAEALVPGDIHVGLNDEKVTNAVFGPGGLAAATRPRKLFLHDLYDGRKVNPHERSQALMAAIRAPVRVADEILDVSEWLAFVLDRCPGLEAALVVRSNHDLFLDRWLQAAKPEPIDAELFHWLSWRMLAGHRETGAFPNPLELALRAGSSLDPRIRFLHMDESFQIGALEMGMHGHAGPNGARGGPKNMARIGTKFVAGHIHGPCIWKGGYWTGVFARLAHGYNQGPSNWFHTLVLVHANFKRQMVHIIDGAHRG